MPKNSSYKEQYQQLKLELKKMKEYYQMEKVGIPPRIEEKAKTILKSESLEKAEDIFKRTVNSMELEALVMWGKGKIPGPLTPQNLEAQARKAESFAKLHLRKGNEKVAEQQKKKAEQLRQHASVLREQKEK